MNGQAGGRDPVAELCSGLARLEETTGTPAVLVRAAVEHDTVTALARCLRGLQAGSDLDVVLMTLGGFLPAARKLALLLRRDTRRVRVLVPGIARSAGTLLALAADEIVFGAAGELGPLDAQLAAEGRPAAGPSALSVEDVRRFPELAAEWFGVAEHHGVALLSLLCRHVFPPSLTSLYRQDRAVTRTAAALLDRQLPGSSDDERARVVRRLVEGHAGHDDGVLLEDALRAGLRARAAGDDEDACLDAVADAAEAACGDAAAGAPVPGRDVPAGSRAQVLGVVVGAGRVARQLGVAHADGQYGTGWTVEDAPPPSGPARPAAGPPGARG